MVRPLPCVLRLQRRAGEFDAVCGMCGAVEDGVRECWVPVDREKGIDLRLGLDVVRMARNGELDVAIVFSQDQDLAEVAHEIRDIAEAQGRWLKIGSAFPHGPNATVRRGIDRTDWFQMDRDFYDACLDPRDYRPRRR